MHFILSWHALLHCNLQSCSQVSCLPSRLIPWCCAPSLLKQVDEADYSQEVCILQSAAHSFTKADGQLVNLFLGAPVMLQPGKVCAYMLGLILFLL